MDETTSPSGEPDSDLMTNENGDCEAATQESLQSSDVVDEGAFALSDEELTALEAAMVMEDEAAGEQAIAQALGGCLGALGGGWGGSEAPVRRAMVIGRQNGLTITSTKRTWGNTGSDHHTNQRTSFAADMSNGNSPTPQMDRTARQIAAACGHSGWRGGLLNVRTRGYRLQLIWRYEGHYNHVHVGVRRL